MIIIETKEDREGKEIHTYREDYLESECKKEECGAWHEGKCEYRREN